MCTLIPDVMSIVSSLESIGEYVELMRRVMAPPDRAREFFKEFSKEVYKLGVNSIWLVMIISFFIGAVIVMQIAINVASPLLPRFTVGVVSREIILLEFSSTIMCLILRESGVQYRFRDRHDACNGTDRCAGYYGVNSANYLIMPKVSAFVFFMPVLVALSMFLGLFGGYIICLFTGTPPVSTYIYGIQFFFRESFVWTSIVKSMIYGFIIASVSAYFGYRVKGGSLEVGKASTDSVVINNILILAADLVFTQLVMG